MTAALHPGGTRSAVAMVVGSCVSLQFGAALAAHLFPVAGAWAVTAMRLAIAAGLLVAITRPRIRRWSRRQWRTVCLLGAALAAMNGCFYAAIERLPLGVAVSIEFLGPLVLAAALSRRRTDLVSVALALTGMALLGVEAAVHATSLDPIGVLFALAAASFWAVYIVVNARVAQSIPGTDGLAMALAVAAVVVLPIGLTQELGALLEPQWLGIAAATALLASVIPYSLELAALRRIPRHVFGVLLAFEPVFATVAGWLLLHQGVSPLRMTAIGLVIIATLGTVATGERSRRARAAEETPAPLATPAPT
ncbi:EamA family transporter [Gordonia soli]|uniref:Putative amino acid efflux protein n=1 Tax=Gordonia soli NBRC 108243 TaxID=1223545 RepID=M0QFX5_9ACTN|nr:EamA family transporter [Gordonia soli]GAC67468.1 putative amino acid efflux protein [Gordonia soli NBRC 108243]